MSSLKKSSWSKIGHFYGRLGEFANTCNLTGTSHSNVGEKLINAKKKSVSSIIRSIIRRLLRALGENKLLKLMRLASHNKNTEMSTIF